MRQAVSFIPQSVTGMGLDAKCGGRKRKRVAAAEGNKRAKQAKMIQLTVEEAKFSATPAAQGKRKMTTFCKPDVEQLCAVLLAKGVPQEDVDGAIKKKTVKAVVALAKPYIVDGYISMECAPKKEVKHLLGPMYVMQGSLRHAFDASMPLAEVRRAVAEKAGVEPSRVSITGTAAAGSTLECAVSDPPAEEAGAGAATGAAAAGAGAGEEVEEEVEVSAADVAQLDMEQCKAELRKSRKLRRIAGIKGSARMMLRQVRATLLQVLEGDE